MTTRTKFLNVDLELRANSSLDQLLEALEPFAFVMDYEAENWASLELNDEPQSAVDAIRLYSEAIQSLQPPERTIWEGLKSRCFNIGIQAGDEPYQAFFRLPPETIALISAMKAEIAFTVYGANADVS